MFDWIRERLKDAETKREERVTAYVDGRLSADQTRQFEAQMAQDEILRAEVAALQAVKQQLTALPSVRAPRNYTLDPAIYGAPDPAYGARLYPTVRVATAMAALMFIFMVTLTLLSNNGADDTAMSEAVAVQMMGEADTTADEEESVAFAVEEAAEIVVEEADVVEEAEPMADAVMEEEPEVFAEVELLEEEVAADAEPEPTDSLAVAADGEVMDDADAADETSVARSGVATATIEVLPTIAPFTEVAPVTPEVVIPTSEVARSADSITATENTMPDMTTEQTEDEVVGETVVSAETTTDWTQTLLIVSAILFVILLALAIWLRRTAL